MLRAFQITDYEIWAAETPEAAIEAFIVECGEECREQLLSPVIELTHEDMSHVLSEEYGEGTGETLLDYLSRMDTPGLLAGCD